MKNWIKYGRFEEKHGYIAHSRKVYERAVEFFGEDYVDENLFVAFAKFEETQKEVCDERSQQTQTKASCFQAQPEHKGVLVFCLPQFERVRVIYKYALDRIPKHQAQELFKFYTMFEKKFGDRRGIEDVIVNKRRFQYEEEVKVLIWFAPIISDVHEVSDSLSISESQSYFFFIKSVVVLFKHNMSA